MKSLENKSHESGLYAVSPKVHSHICFSPWETGFGPLDLLGIWGWGPVLADSAGCSLSPHCHCLHFPGVPQLEALMDRSSQLLVKWD